jgi:hypothetical protein
MKTHRLMGVATVCLYLLLPGATLAQETGPQEQFNQAVELVTGGDYGKAVKVCLDVMEQLPESEQPRVHKLLGYAYMKLEMLPESWHHLTSYLQSSGKEDTTAGGWLQEVETALKQTHVKVSLTCTPSGTRLSLPSSQSSSLPVSQSCPTTWWMKPGKHTVKATAPEHMPRSVEIDVRERGDSGMRDIRLAAIDSGRTPGGGKSGSGPTGTTIVKPVEPKMHSRAVEWALIGSGLALGVTGGIFHGIGYSKNEDLHDKYLNTEDYPIEEEAQMLYDDAREEKVRPKEIAAYVLYGVGGAAVLAGIVTWAVRKPGGTDERASGLTISPMLLPGSGTGAVMTFEF